MTPEPFRDGLVPGDILGIDVERFADARKNPRARVGDFGAFLRAHDGALRLALA